MKRILLIGGSGQLGTALQAASPHEIAAPRHEEFDLVTGNAPELIEHYAPDVLINCAAFHNVDRCEVEPESAFAANGIAVDRLAAECARRDVLFVTISTDYVFSGDADRPYTEHDTPAPRTVYGASKLAGEILTRRHGPRHLIVRTSGVFGTKGTSSKGYTLIDKVLAQAERGEPTRMVADMTFSPSYAPHLATAIWEMIDGGQTGTHHLTNAGACTWFAFVAEAFHQAGLTSAVLEPTSYALLGNSTRRPMYSPLRSAQGAPALPSWKNAISDYLAVRSQG